MEENAKRDINMVAMEVGISIKGLPTTAPYCKGSLMLKMEGPSVALPSRRNFLDFARSMNSASGRVAP